MKQHAFSIYNASAGAGKTYTLVKEYLKIILLSPKPDAYRNILAITFTNKAVHEMKTRVVSSLHEFTKEFPSEKAQNLLNDLSRETQLSLEEIKKKSQEIIRHLIYNYAAFDISTIDKFTHRVIRSFAHDLNLPITFEVSLDTETLLTEAVDAIIAQAGNDELLTQLLIDFTMEKTDDDKSWDVSRDIFNVGKLILNENNREEIKQLEEKKIQLFLDIKNKLREACLQLEKQISNNAKKIIELLQNNNIDESAFSYKTFYNHILFLTQNDDRANTKRYYNFEEIAIKRDANIALIEELSGQFLPLLKKCYQELEKTNYYKAFLKNITPLSLLNEINQKLKQIQQEQNTLSISEFNKIIHDQIKNQPAPFIYERMGEKYRHFFIDEFQDTSQMQWENLIPLINNALAGETLQGERGSLLLVGDPKQSIYRWRGGKAEQFIELTKDKNPFSNPDKNTIPLETNYRSYSQIIDFNNSFFQFISNEFENEDYLNLYKNNSYQKTTNKIGGYVNITFLPKQEKIEPEIDKVEEDNPFLQATLNTIYNVRNNNFAYSDIAILIRKNDQGTQLANYLTENGIPVISSESLLLSASSEVQFLINFLQYLENCSNLEAKAHIFYFLANKLKTNLAVHDFIATAMNLTEENQLEKWLQQFNMQLSFADFRRKSLYELTENIINKTITVFNNESNAYVQYFLDLILEHDFKKQSGITDFLNFWYNNSHKLSIPLPEGNDAVKIMTIHKAKGLEFPVVIFPFANTSYAHKPQEKIWLNANEDEAGISKMLVAKNSSVLNFGEENALLYKQKLQEELLDNINILYVALTRAEEQLYIISEKVTANKEGKYPNTMASYFLRFLINKKFDENLSEYHEGNPSRNSKYNESKNTGYIIPQVTHLLNTANIKIAQRESLMWNTKQLQAIEFGNTIHEIMAFINTKNDVNFAVEKALQTGLITASQKQEVLETIDKIVNNKELTDYFIDNLTVMNEQAILQKQGSLIKPDRIAIDTSKNVWLLDYKTGLPLPKHKTQINHYKEVIESMNYNVKKTVLVYIGNEIEVVDANN